MKLFSIDREGWLSVEESVAGAEDYHEWIDVMDGEYLFIDDEGFLYEPCESKEGSQGYELRQTLSQRPEILEIVLRYRDGEKLSPEHSSACRRTAGAQ